MRVSEFPSTQMLRYGRENRKCWSQIALASMGGKQVFFPSYVIGASCQNIMAPTDCQWPQQNCYSRAVCTLDQYLQSGSEIIVLLP